MSFFCFIKNNDSGHVSRNNSDNELENDADLDNETHAEDEDMHDVEEKVEKVGKEIDGISQDNWKLLEKVKTTQRQDHLKVILLYSLLLFLTLMLTFVKN